MNLLRPVESSSKYAATFAHFNFFFNCLKQPVNAEQFTMLISQTKPKFRVSRCATVVGVKALYSIHSACYLLPPESSVVDNYRMFNLGSIQKTCMLATPRHFSSLLVAQLFLWPTSFDHCPRDQKRYQVFSLLFRYLDYDTVQFVRSHE